MHALVVEDERNMRLLLGELLASEGYRVDEAERGEDALLLLEGDGGRDIELVLLDLRLPGIDGLAVLERVHAQRPELPVVVLTAHGSIDTAVAATRAGAFDFLVKPVDVPRLRELLRRVRGSSELTERARLMAPRVSGSTERDRAAPDQRTAPPRAPRPGAPSIIGAATGLRAVVRTIEQVAATDVSVLITGESGTGKELIANAIHQASGRKAGPFVSINCAALPETLLESELFGFEKGSFTGAESRKLGVFELASGGTLFLDEIGDMALALQAKILRALQERRVTRIGGRQEVEVDVRILSATNQDLARAIEAGRFRRDLFYRLNVIATHLPPLRERGDDVPALVRHFLERSAERHGRPGATFSAATLEALGHHRWPGNVRELENAVEKGVLLGEEAMLAELDLVPVSAPEDLRPLGAANARPVTLKEVTEAAQREAIVHAIRHAGGNKRQAAKALDVSYKTLFNKLRELGIQTKLEVG